MGRPQTRTTAIGASVTTAILAAFGTAWNAYRQLDLSDTGVTVPIFNRALRSESINPADAETILTAWERRRLLPVAA